MGKYSKQLMYDYLIGNNIDEYDVDELENDYEFIKGVSDISNDKKIYNLCDDKLKSNFELMKFFILKFKDDKDFIRKVANDFIKLSINEDDKFEINIMISEFCKIEYDDFSKNTSAISAKCKYVELMATYTAVIEKCNQETKDVYQMGFEYFYDNYIGRKTIINYIAKNMLSEVFNPKEESLEEIIHMRFKNKEALQKMGINNFILAYVSSYDSNLSDYLKANMEIISDIYKKIKKIENNFDNYNSRKKHLLLNSVVEFLDEYSINENYLTGPELVKYISKDFRLSDPIIDRVLEIFDDYGDYICEKDYSTVQTDIKYIRAKKQVKEMLETGQICENCYEQEKQCNKSKVLNFRNNSCN